MTISGKSAARLSEAPPHSLERALRGIDSRASEYDSARRFPAESFAYLRDCGALQASAAAQCSGFADRLCEDAALVRAVARADGSTARILDGHLNGVERLAMLGDEPLRSRELSQVADGELLVGVWGADPGSGEGEPARLHKTAHGFSLSGSKVFCSGAGGVDRALVVVTDEDDARRLAYVDTSTVTADFITIDRGWYRAPGMRASESHRVRFQQTPVMAVLGGPDVLAAEPWFSRDAVRTSATWVGLAERIVQETAAALEPEQLDSMQAYRLGRMRVAIATVDLWIDRALGEMRAGLGESSPPVDFRRLATVAAECRISLSEHCAVIREIASGLTGSRFRVSAGALDRAMRDLELFLLQHRLDRKVIALGTDMAGNPGERW